MSKNEENNTNSNKTSMDALTERLNRIKKNLEKKEENKEKKDPEINIKSDQKDLILLKDKIVSENPPQLKEVKDLDKNMQIIKKEFNEANDTNVSKEKFSSFINRANEMFKNYEKQLQYYSMYNGKYNTKDLTISSNNDITSFNERNFSILSDKKKVFEKELNKLITK